MFHNARMPRALSPPCIPVLSALCVVVAQATLLIGPHRHCHKAGIHIGGLVDTSIFECCPRTATCTHGVIGVVPSAAQTGVLGAHTHEYGPVLWHIAAKRLGWCGGGGGCVASACFGRRVGGRGRGTSWGLCCSACKQEQESDDGGHGDGRGHRDVSECFRGGFCLGASVVVQGSLWCLWCLWCATMGKQC